MMASYMAFREDQKLYYIPTLERGDAIVCVDENDTATWIKITLWQKRK